MNRPSPVLTVSGLSFAGERGIIALTMSTMSQTKFLRSLPKVLYKYLPAELEDIQSRQPYSWLVQFYFGAPQLHYEFSRVYRRDGWELGFHCESRDKQLNRKILLGLRRNLFEIKDNLGEEIEAEMWDRGWTKIYEVIPGQPLTPMFQDLVAKRISEIVICLQPILRDILTMRQSQTERSSQIP